MAILTLSIRVGNSLVVPPFVGVGCIIHANFEVLGDGEEEVAIIRELTRIYGIIIVDYGISIRGR